MIRLLTVWEHLIKQTNAFEDHLERLTAQLEAETSLVASLTVTNSEQTDEIRRLRFEMEEMGRRYDEATQGQCQRSTGTH